MEWFKQNEAPRTYLYRYSFADGQSFEIFNHVTVTAPIIFTTAYDQYALEAFKVNSIDYLLKPIKKEELKRAIEKFLSLNAPTEQTIDFQKLLTTLQGQTYLTSNDLL